MTIVYSAEQIREATVGLAQEINRDYEGQQVHLLGVLKGAFIFMADLVRHLELSCTMDFVRLSSYGTGTTSSGMVKEVMARRDLVRGRHVIVVEEIVDTGLTLSKLLQEIESEGPASLKVCTLIDKIGNRQVQIPIHYRGMILEGGFLIGYGLDSGEEYRNLPVICPMEDRER